MVSSAVREGQGQACLAPFITTGTTDSGVTHRSGCTSMSTLATDARLCALRRKRDTCSEPEKRMRAQTAHPTHTRAHATTHTHAHTHTHTRRRAQTNTLGQARGRSRTHRSGDASVSGLAIERRLAPAPTEPSAHARNIAHACMRARARYDQTRARAPSRSRGSTCGASAALMIGGSGCSHHWRAWIVWHLAGLLTMTRSSLSRWVLARLRRSGAFGRRGRAEPLHALLGMT